jgi:hypothetical protein
MKDKKEEYRDTHSAERKEEDAVQRQCFLCMVKRGHSTSMAFNHYHEAHGCARLA